MFIEPLAQAVWQIKEITQSCVERCRLVEDDVIGFLQQSNLPFPTLMKHLKTYGNFSGCKINIAKIQMNYTPPKNNTRLVET